MPPPSPEGAADVLAQAGVDAPDGHRNRGACVSAIARAQGGEEERTPEERAAFQQAEDACPKGGRGRGAGGPGEQCPGRPVEGETCVRGPGRTGGPGSEGAPGQPTPPALERAPGGCDGPPPWAGGRLSKEEKRDAQAARAAACGTDDPAGEVEPVPEGAPDG